MPIGSPSADRGNPAPTASSITLDVYARILRENIVEARKGWGGLKVFRHVTARSWLTKCFLQDREAYDRDMVASEFEKLIGLIKSSYALYTCDRWATNPIMEYLRGSLQQLEVETYHNNSNFDFFELFRLGREDSNETEKMRDLYLICTKYMGLAIEKQDGLKSTIMYKDAFARKQMEMTALQLQSQLASIEKEFSYLDAKKKAVPLPDLAKSREEERKRVLELSEKLMNVHNEERGEYTEAITYGLQHAQKLMQMGCENPFEILDLLLKLLPKSLRTLGPSHKLTKNVQSNFQQLVSCTRKAALRDDVSKGYFPALRYEEDCDIYIMNVEGNEDITGNELACSPSELILQTGAFVECVDLNGAAHLNGKRGWVGSFDVKTGRHKINFEDKDIKSCLVKPDNLRLLFFDEEVGDEGEVKKTASNVEDHREEIDNEMPDLV